MLLVWGGFCLLLGGYNLALYPYFVNAPEYGFYLAKLPDWFHFIIGQPEQLDLPAVFLTLTTFSLTAPLVWTMLAVKISLDETAAEEETGQLAFLLIHPVQRWKLYLVKALAILTLVVLMGLILWGSLAGASTLEKAAIGAYWLAGATLDVGVFVLVCSALAMLFGALSGRVDLSSTLAGGVVVIMWLVEGLARLGRLQPIAHWVNPYGMISMSIMQKNAITPWVLAMMAGLILLCWAGGAAAWERRSLLGLNE